MAQWAFPDKKGNSRTSTRINAVIKNKDPNTIPDTAIQRPGWFFPFRSTSEIIPTMMLKEAKGIPLKRDCRYPGPPFSVIR